ncbi:AraC family transcriptional regulator [Salinicola corii]|uniref:AraC family transcriptional regulator n=1 Tax=Salinicola corii TaxID=2606937 RepID=A0A640WIT1_9GAMM|nr:AraC family transcriptional regulator [Salinicola corii]KAA0020490.1 AraC family transcriptional regulator [Salinicola corii]
MADNSADWCIVASPSRIERLEARFQGHAYDTHRHDTFAIGITLDGVQSFHYRRDYRHSLPGTVMVLHPDEAHDGHAGDERGFHYRMLYIAPALIQTALGGKALPHIAGGLSTDPRLREAVRFLLTSVEAPLDALEEENGIADLADVLEANSDTRIARSRTTPDYRAASRVRDYLDTHTQEGVTLDDLESISGQERWTLSRDFRALFGTSPYRYLTLRRLDVARQCIATGISLSEAALSAGFADQSHMTRAFGRAFGMTPSRWRSLLKRG